MPVYIQRMIARGDIYRGEYTGWYDAGQEEYVTETAAKESDFKSAITGKALGQYESILGHAQVRQVSPEFSEATFVPGRDQLSPRPEDGVRISRGRIKVAITPVLDLTGGTADLRRVPYLFASVLDRTRRFQVVDPFAVTDMFASGDVRPAPGSTSARAGGPPYGANTYSMLLMKTSWTTALVRSQRPSGPGMRRAVFVAWSSSCRMRRSALAI